MSFNQGLTNTTARALSRSWSKRGMTRAEIKKRKRKKAFIIHNALIQTQQSPGPAIFFQCPRFALNLSYSSFHVLILIEIWPWEKMNWCPLMHNSVYSSFVILIDVEQITTADLLDKTLSKIIRKKGLCSRQNNKLNDVFATSPTSATSLNN